jgi:hypothetical protein
MQHGIQYPEGNWSVSLTQGTAEEDKGTWSWLLPFACGVITLCLLCVKDVQD